MDSITHIALGACIGEAFFKNGFGKKAMAWGALAQSIPDIDFVAAFWTDTTGSLITHRGFTHSILFAVLIIPLFALLAAKIHRPHNITFKKWLLFFSTEIFIHLFIDGFNNYGIGWLEPFSHRRYTFNAIYVVDLFFSTWSVIAFIMLLLLNKNSLRRAFWWKLGVILPFTYLAYCSVNKFIIDREVKLAFKEQHIPHEQYFTTPAPLQNWLWFVAAGNDNGYYVGYKSIFDRSKSIDLKFFPKNDSLLNPFKNEKSVNELIRFSREFYTVEKWHDTLVFNNLGFGQIIGWKDPNQHFAFHFFLQYPEENLLVVQRGRFAKWDWETSKALLKRAKGN